MFISSKLCGRFLHNRSRKKTILRLYQVDVQIKHTQNEKHFFNSTKRYIEDEFQRSTTGITRVLVDASCSPCRPWTNKTREIVSCDKCDARRFERHWRVTCIRGRARNIGLRGKSQTKITIIFAVAIYLIISVIRHAKNNFEPIRGCLG